MDTRQAIDIDTMEAGPEMDALVAEKVMGWHQIYGFSRYNVDETLEIGEHEAWCAVHPEVLEYMAHNPNSYLTEGDGDYKHPVHAWKPSSNMTNAFEVVKYLCHGRGDLTKYTNFRIVHYAYNRTYALFSRGEEWDNKSLVGEGNGDYADEEAICRAALKTVLS